MPRAALACASATHPSAFVTCRLCVVRHRRLTELNATLPGLYVLNTAFSLVVTGASAVFILVLRPSTIMLSAAWVARHLCWSPADTIGVAGMHQRAAQARHAAFTPTGAEAASPMEGFMEGPLEDLWRLFSKV